MAGFELMEIEKLKQTIARLTIEVSKKNLSDTRREIVEEQLEDARHELDEALLTIQTTPDLCPQHTSNPQQ
jgi:hypothetical protein